MFSLTPGRPTGMNMIMNLMRQSMSENISCERSYFFYVGYNVGLIECTTLNTFCQLLKDSEMMNYLSDSLILVTIRIGGKRPIDDLFFTIVLVFCTFGILYFRLQIWCQALQSLTTYLMLTTYSWMLCEGAYLRFILVFADNLKTFTLFKLWLYIMHYCWWIFKLFKI